MILTKERLKKEGEVYRRKTIFIKKRPISQLPGMANIPHNNRIGAGFTAPVLTPEEEEQFLPNIIKRQPSDIRWQDEVENYFKNISVQVPEPDGLKLEIGFAYPNEEAANRGEDSNETEKHKYGEPINVSNYVLYRHCLVYGKVANIGVDYNKSPKIQFYMTSPNHDNRIKTNAAQSRLKAYEILAEIKTDHQKLSSIIDVLANDPFSGIGIIEPGMELAEIDTYIQTNAAKFVEIANDKDLNLRATIERCINLDILNRAENTNIIMYDTSIIGNTTNEAIAFLKDENNAKLFNTIKSQLDMKSQPVYEKVANSAQILEKVNAITDNSSELKEKDDEIARLRAQLDQMESKKEKVVTDNKVDDVESENKVVEASDTESENKTNNKSGNKSGK